MMGDFFCPLTLQQRFRRGARGFLSFPFLSFPFLCLRASMAALAICFPCIYVYICTSARTYILLYIYSSIKLNFIFFLLGTKPIHPYSFLPLILHTGWKRLVIDARPTLCCVYRRGGPRSRRGPPGSRFWV